VLITDDLKDPIAMKAHSEYLTLNIPSKMAFVNITPQVQEALRKSGVPIGFSQNGIWTAGRITGKKRGPDSDDANLFDGGPIR